MINGGFVFSPLHYKAKRNRSLKAVVQEGCRSAKGVASATAVASAFARLPSGSGLDNVGPSLRLERALAGFFLGLLKHVVFFRWLRAAAIVQGACISDEIRPKISASFCRNSGTIPAFAIAETKPCRRDGTKASRRPILPSTLPGSIPPLA